MRADPGILVNRYTRPTILSAVLMGCVFAFPPVAGVPGITLQIIKPDRYPIVFDAGWTHEFGAVAFTQGAELEGRQVVWRWDFADGTANDAANSNTHAYATRGNPHVVVTTIYGPSQPRRNSMSGPTLREPRSHGRRSLSLPTAVAPAAPRSGGQVRNCVSPVVRLPEATIGGHLDVM